MPGAIFVGYLVSEGMLFVCTYIYIYTVHNNYIYLHNIFVCDYRQDARVSALSRHGTLAALPVRNNWSDNNVVQEAGGSTYSATSACGQLHQSYQAEERDVWMVIIHNNS
jgi:hypothetical protein